jgi:FkbM family methyltransferase
MWMINLLECISPLNRSIFLDIGANIGQTLLKLKSCRPDLPWVGIEPNPSCVAYLEQLIRVNAFAQCTVVPIALHTSDELKVLEFYTADGTDSAASLVENLRPDQPVFRRTLVPAFSYRALETLVPRDNVAFIKIDVEGGEKEVLESILPILKASRPPILIEVLPVYSQDNTSRFERQRALETIFATCEYRIYRVQKDDTGGFFSLLPVETIGVHGDINWSDYFVLPTERADELAQALDGRIYKSAM